MTVIDASIDPSIEPTVRATLLPVAFDLYRDIHKGIRSELFAVVTTTGRIDPSDRCGVAALCEHVHRTIQLLVEHAHHEDGTIQPALERHAPALAERVADDHDSLDRRLVWLGDLATAVTADGTGRASLHELYIELSSFTSAYLQHQDLEERVVGQALESALGVDGVVDLHMAIVGGMPPEQLISGLAVMFPAMNVEDRTELLVGMRDTAPAEAFEGVWSLAMSVLDTDDAQALRSRLGRA